MAVTYGAKITKEKEVVKAKNKFGDIKKPVKKTVSKEVKE